MPSLRQLEFAFQTVAASLWHAPRFAQQSGYKASALEAKARQLLCSLGAKRIATELRVDGISVSKPPRAALIIARN